MLEAYPPIEWPPPPTRLSFSALETVTACPRRWAYGRARYAPGGLADERGVFLRRASWSAVRGNVIHEVLEQLLDVHQRGGGPPPGSWALVKFWRDHLPPGGVPSLVAARAAALIERRTADPRNILLRPGMKRLAAREAEALVASVNAKLKYALVAATARPAGPCTAAAAGGPSAPLEAPPSAAAPEQRFVCSIESADGSCDWWGDADVVRKTDDGPEIIDYKTGAPKEAHRRQLEVYALLFARDRRRNPRGVLATKLRIIYEADQTETWPAPDADGLRALEAALVKESLAAIDSLREAPPPARVDDKCAWCDARPVCEEYWRSPAGAAATAAGRRRDLEVTVLSVGQSAAEVGAFDGQHQLRLLLSQAMAACYGELLPGAVIRVIAAKRAPLDDDPSPVPNGEVYEVDDTSELVCVPRQSESSRPLIGGV